MESNYPKYLLTESRGPALLEQILSAAGCFAMGILPHHTPTPTPPRHTANLFIFFSLKPILFILNVSATFAKKAF